MDPEAGHDLVADSSCTTCQFAEDFSNYWTAVMYFRARNGTFKRVPQIAQTGVPMNGGMVSCLKFSFWTGYCLLTKRRSSTT